MHVEVSSVIARGIWAMVWVPLAVTIIVVIAATVAVIAMKRAPAEEMPRMLETFMTAVVAVCSAVFGRRLQWRQHGSDSQRDHDAARHSIEEADR